MIHFQRKRWPHKVSQLEATSHATDLFQEVSSQESWAPSQQLPGHLFGKCTRPTRGCAEVAAATRPAQGSVKWLSPACSGSCSHRHPGMEAPWWPMMQSCHRKGSWLISSEGLLSESCHQRRNSCLQFVYSSPFGAFARKHKCLFSGVQFSSWREWRKRCLFLTG